MHENKVENGENTLSKITKTNTDEDSITTDKKDSVIPGEAEIATGTNGRTEQKNEAFVARPFIQFMQSIKKSKRLLKNQL